MIGKEKIKNIVTEFLQGRDIFLVHVTVSMTNKISVFVDSMSGITLDKCIEISRAIESNFDREVEDFELEVSSPGAAQPFLVIEQYHKNIGKDIEVLFTNGEKIKAKLLEVSETHIVVEPIDEKKKKAKAVELKEIKNILLKDIKLTKALFKIK